MPTCWSNNLNNLFGNQTITNAMANATVSCCIADKADITVNKITSEPTTTLSEPMTFEAEVTIRDKKALEKIIGLSKQDEKPKQETKPEYVVPVPTYISQRGKATIVHWEDGTYTSVLCGDSDSDNVYAAYCAALAKKIYGTTSAVHKHVDRHLSSTINAKKQQEIDRQRKVQQERARINEEREVRLLAKSILLRDKAVEYLAQHYDELSQIGGDDE